MSRVRFEPTISVFEREKTVHASDCAAAVIGTVLCLPYRKHQTVCVRRSHHLCYCIQRELRNYKSSMPEISPVSMHCLHHSPMRLIQVPTIKLQRLSRFHEPQTSYHMNFHWQISWILNEKL
jgi:hypothetical protein